MADDNQTLRDVLAGFNKFQASMGLLPISGQMFGFNQPQTTPRAPDLKSPSQAAMEIMQQSQSMVQQAQQAFATTQNLLAMRPVQTLSAFAPSVGSAGAAQQYGQDFSSRMSQIQSQYITPQSAHFMAQRMGGMGFQNMPSPIYQTDPSMGVFRPGFTPPTQTNMAVQALPWITTPFTPRFPQPMFQVPREREYQQAVIRNEERFSMLAATTPVLANVATTGLATGMGMGIGGAIGGGWGASLAARAGQTGTAAATRIAGMRGLGRIGGAALGLAAGVGFLGEWGEQGMEALQRPIISRRAMGRQMEEISRQFVIQGPELHELGQGLSTRAATTTTNQMRRMVENRETAGFNMRDMMRLTGLAAEGGMLDMAQNGEQISQTMGKIARALRGFMQIAEQPDVRVAMKQMAQMRQMGLTIPETTVAMQNARQFARMAGTSMEGLIQTSGMPGAMTFQQMGLTAGLGLQVGMGAAGLARQGVASGTFTPQQLALSGGVRGIQQTLTESSGAALGVNFQTMALLTRDANGRLSIDPNRLQRMMSGEYGLGQQANMAAGNIQRLAQMGGTSPERVITEFRSRINELRDQLGRQLGPMGGNLLLIRQALNLQRTVGGRIDLGSALQQIAPNLDTNQIRSIQLMAENPDWWQGQMQHQRQRIADIRSMEAQRRANRPSWFGRWWNERGLTERAGEMVGGTLDDISQWWSDRERSQRATARGAHYIAGARTPAFRATTQARRREQQRAVQRGDLWDDRMLATGPVEMVTSGQYAASVWDAGLATGSTLLGFATGGLSTTVGLGVTAAGNYGATFAMSSTADESLYTSALRAGGGWGGFVGRNMGWAANLFSTGDMRMAAHTEAQQQQITGQALQQGRALGSREKQRQRKIFVDKTKELSRTLGLDPKKTRDVHEILVQSAIRTAKQHVGVIYDSAMRDDTLKKNAIEDLVKAGFRRDDATYLLNQDKGGVWAAIRPSVLAEAEAAAPESASGVFTQSSNAGDYAAAFAAGNLKNLEAKFADAEKQLKSQTGFYNWLNASDESWKQFTEDVASQSGRDTLLMQAAALEKAGKSEEADKLFAQAETTFGGDTAAFGDAREAARTRIRNMKDTQREMWWESGMISAAPGVDALKRAEKTKKTLQQITFGKQVKAGIAELAPDFGALSQITQQGVLSPDAAVNAMRSLAEDPAKLDQLRKRDRKLADLVDSLAGTDKTDTKKARALGMRFLEEMSTRGPQGDKDTELGGAGGGTKEEATVKKQMGQIQALADAVKEFNKSSGRLDSASGALERAAHVLESSGKLPPRN